MSYKSMSRKLLDVTVCSDTIFLLFEVLNKHNSRCFGGNCAWNSLLHKVEFN